MSKTEHTVIQQTDIMRRKGKSLYKCKNCKIETWKKHLRPSAESSY